LLVTLLADGVSLTIESYPLLELSETSNPAGAVTTKSLSKVVPETEKLAGDDAVP
jgi:hypothetical protein